MLLLLSRNSGTTKVGSAVPAAMILPAVNELAAIVSVTLWPGPRLPKQSLRTKFAPDWGDVQVIEGSELVTAANVAGPEPATSKNVNGCVAVSDVAWSPKLMSTYLKIVEPPAAAGSGEATNCTATRSIHSVQVTGQNRRSSLSTRTVRACRSPRGTPHAQSGPARSRQATGQSDFVRKREGRPGRRRPRPGGQNACSYPSFSANGALVRERGSRPQRQEARQRADSTIGRGLRLICARVVDSDVLRLLSATPRAGRARRHVRAPFCPATRTDGWTLESPSRWSRWRSIQGRRSLSLRLVWPSFGLG